MSGDRLLQLLADRVTEGLDDEHEGELDRLLEAVGEGDRSPDHRAEMEFAAAAVHVALLEEMVGEWEPIPGPLRDRILAEVAATEQLPAGPEAAPAASRLPGFVPTPRGALETEERQAGARVIPMRPLSVLPWLAAAAGLTLAVLAWWPQLRAPAAAPPVVDIVSQPTPSIDPQRAVELRGELVAEASDATVVEWSATEDPATAADAGGDVVWSGEQQAGFMRFRGLAANDPSEYQYQLWIFDKGRDERYPVDGGVFNVPAGADEVIVPIIPKLPVGEPYLFAITVEPPGGVVVSSRERIALVAQPA